MKRWQNSVDVITKFIIIVKIVDRRRKRKRKMI